MGSFLTKELLGPGLRVLKNASTLSLLKYIHRCVIKQAYICFFPFNVNTLDRLTHIGQYMLIAKFNFTFLISDQPL